MRDTATSWTERSANGTFALAQFYGGDYKDQAGFDSLYTGLIPEPGTLAFLSAGGLALALRRRRRPIG